MASWSPLGNLIWFGYFSPLKVILGAKVTNATGDAIYFNVDGDGRLWHVYYIRCVDVRQHFGYSSSCKIGKKWSNLSSMLALLLIVGLLEKNSS